MVKTKEADRRDVESGGAPVQDPIPRQRRRNVGAADDMLTTEILKEQRPHSGFYQRMNANPKTNNNHGSGNLGQTQYFRADRTFDFQEEEGSHKVHTLRDYQFQLHNPEADKYRRRKLNPFNLMWDRILDVLAAFYVYAANMIGLETLLVIANSAIATWFFVNETTGDEVGKGEPAIVKFSAKLDFSFLAFCVVFPLTFLIQSTFGRRDQALNLFADLKGAVLATVLLELTTDWPSSNGSPIGGRYHLPATFNATVVNDTRDLLQLVYEYLSMPNVMQARNIVFRCKQNSVIRVHGRQNAIIKQFNALMLDFSMHTEEMRKYGFPSGEASLLHKYHQYLQQRWEKLRIIKYYRTPQATRAFGRVYIFILPWLCGPYFAWVFDEMDAHSKFYSIALSCFTFVILLSLLNTTIRLEDPFFSDSNYWSAPGLDCVKLDFEMASILQAVEQYFMHAEQQRSQNLNQQREQMPMLADPSEQSQTSLLPIPPPPASRRPIDKIIPPKLTWEKSANDKGETYYYHTETHKSQWTKPPEFDAQVAAFEKYKADIKAANSGGTKHPQERELVSQQRGFCQVCFHNLRSKAEYKGLTTAELKKRCHHTKQGCSKCGESFHVCKTCWSTWNHDTRGVLASC